jgi:hypothetical protein
MERSAMANESERLAVLREAVTMMLYVSILVLAEIAALPTFEGDPHAFHGRALLALIWGTALGVAAAHWFSFRLAARLFSPTGDVNETDVLIGIAQIAGAAAVAALCTIPVVLVDDDSELRVTIFVPALIVAAAGFATARTAGRSTRYAVVVALLAMAAGLLIAGLKNVLAGH